METMYTRPVEPLDVQTDMPNIGTRWKKWIDRFDNFLEAMGITADERKKALLLHWIGEAAYDIYQSLPEPSNPNQSQTADTYERAKQKLSDYFLPKINTEFEIFNFRQAKQTADETIDQFYARLLKLSINCDFSDRNKEIKSQIILSSNSSSLRRYSLREQPKLEELIAYGKTLETTSHQLSTIEQQPSQSVNKVNVNNTFNNKFKNYSNKSNNHREKLWLRMASKRKRIVSCSQSRVPELSQQGALR